MLKSLITAIILTTVAGSIGVFAADAQKMQDPGWPDSTQGCMVSQSENGFSVRYVNTKTFESLETVRVPSVGSPSVERTTKERAIIRKNCEVMVLEVLGRARAQQVFRLSN